MLPGGSASSSGGAEGRSPPPAPSTARTSALARTRLTAPSPARLRTSGSKKPLDPDWSRLAPEAPGYGYATGLTAIGTDLSIRARERNGGGERMVDHGQRPADPGPDAARRNPPEAESRPIRRSA